MLLAFCACHATWAQTETLDSKAFNYRNAGLKVGPSLSRVSGASFAVGFHAGVFGEIRERKCLGYSGELLFSHQGGKSGAVNMGLSYLALPVMLNLYAGKTAFQVGPYAGLLLAGNVKSSGGSRDISGSLKSSDFGVTGGLKTMFSEKVGLGLRYWLGLSDVSPNSDTKKNQSLQLSLYYAF